LTHYRFLLLVGECRPKRRENARRNFGTRGEERMAFRIKTIVPSSMKVRFVSPRLSHFYRLDAAYQCSHSMVFCRRIASVIALSESPTIPYDFLSLMMNTTMHATIQLIQLLDRFGRWIRSSRAYRPIASEKISFRTKRDVEKKERQYEVSRVVNESARYEES
jgi:hypothetical protein